MTKTIQQPSITDKQASKLINKITKVFVNNTDNHSYPEAAAIVNRWVEGEGIKITREKKNKKLPIAGEREVDPVKKLYYLMDCSTAHITKDDNDFLAEQVNTEFERTLIVTSQEYGFWVYVPYEMEQIMEKEISDSLRTVLLKAFHANARYLLLDADGSDHEDLPTYEWK